MSLNFKIYLESFESGIPLIMAAASNHKDISTLLILADWLEEKGYSNSAELLRRSVSSSDVKQYRDAMHAAMEELHDLQIQPLTYEPIPTIEANLDGKSYLFRLAHNGIEVMKPRTRRWSKMKNAGNVHRLIPGFAVLLGTRINHWFEPTNAKYLSPDMYNTRAVDKFLTAYLRELSLIMDDIVRRSFNAMPINRTTITHLDSILDKIKDIAEKEEKLDTVFNDAKLARLNNMLFTAIQTLAGMGQQDSSIKAMQARSALSKE